MAENKNNHLLSSQIESLGTAQCKQSTQLHAPSAGVTRKISIAGIMGKTTLPLYHSWCWVSANTLTEWARPLEYLHKFLHADVWFSHTTLLRVQEEESQLRHLDGNSMFWCSGLKNHLPTPPLLLSLYSLKSPCRLKRRG